MFYLTGRGCTPYSKRGNVMNRFRDLAEQLWHELPRREVILDGEIVALDNDGQIVFGSDARPRDPGLRRL